MYQLITDLFTEKFLTTSISVLGNLAVTKPLSIPYREEQHGKSLMDFQQHHDKFASFSNKYYELVDQFLILAFELKLSEAGLQTLNDHLVTFKEHLFDPAYCDARPNVLWNSAREHLEALLVLLHESKISAEKRLDVINNLGFNLLLCSDGIVSYLQEAIQTLVSNGDVIPRTKEILVQQLAIQFVQDNNLCLLEMEVHYVNAFINYFSDDLGLNKRSHEQTVTTDNALIQQHAAACWKIFTEKLPISLVSYLSEELCTAGRQALQEGQLEGESWQHFSNSSIAEFFKSDVIKYALFVQDEQSGHYVVPTDSRSLHWPVARYLMDQGWLQPQENRRLMDLDNGGSLCTLADYWFCWQRKEDSEDQRLPTAEELLNLFEQVTQVLPDQETPLPRLALRALDLAAEQGSAEAAIELVMRYQKGQISKNERPAPKHYWLAADQGNAEAQYKLGGMYFSGQGVSEDKSEASRLFRLAADQGHAQAQCNLGEMYFNAQGVSKDEQEALRLLRLAADQGHAEARCNLGVRYFNGRGITKDEKEALRFFRLAAGQGDTQAQFNLGVMYQDGLGVIKDEQETFRLFQSAADQGHAIAQSNLGVMYREGRGVAKNYQEAFRLFRLAADQGNAGAQYNLGSMYIDDQEVGKNYQEAFRLFRLAADRGNAEAQFNLGVMYFSGQGVVKSEHRAIAYYQLAADQGYARAQLHLGAMYFNGQGVDKNVQEAFRLFQLAAEQGDAQAQFNLGVMYQDGLGVTKDEQKAFQFFQLAEGQGYAQDQCFLGEMYQQIQDLHNNEQQTASSYQAVANHALLVEAMVSFDDQHQPPQGVAAVNNSSFSDSISILPNLDKPVEDNRRT